MEFADGYGLPGDRLFIDPVLLPLKFSRSQRPAIPKAIREIARKKLTPRIIVGLSNSSQGVKEKKLIHPIFLTMAMACGLDTVIADVLDLHFREAVAAAEVILERQPCSDHFL